MSIPKKATTTESPNQKAISRLLKNKPAVFGMIVIVIAVIVAIFGYLLAPDPTPDANDQITELAFKNPGFQVKILAVRKNQPQLKHSFLKKLLFGTQNAYQLIPINNYSFQNDSIKIEIYNGESADGELIKGIEKQYNLADVVNPVLKIEQKSSQQNIEIVYYDLDNKKQKVNIQELQKTISDNLIYKRKFLLGTDKYGRCMLSRLILGVRISLLVGLIAVAISLTIGIFLGAFAGYFGGKIDDFIMLIINTVWSIPTLLLVFAIVLALGKGIGIIFLAVGLTMWVEVARIVRGQVMSLREIQFVEAAQSMGFNHWRIIGKHILPNILGPVMVVAAANFATAILIEAGLSYLGFGIQPPTPSWGTMLNENYGLAIGGKPLLALVPAFAIMLMVLAFNLLGNGFRDALDVKTKSK